MYRGFNLTLDPSFLPFADYEQAGKAFIEAEWPEMEASLSELAGGDRIDGDKVMRNWFRQVDANVFISHSHNDRALAHGLAGYLHEELGLRPFVDSLVWGSADGLLKEFDDRYCQAKPGSAYRYEYDKRNYSTSHVHMMLATSLSEAIDRCECIIFLNTPRSIQVSDAEEHASEVTASPWIYHELNTSRLVRRRPIKRVRLTTRSAQVESYVADAAEPFHLDYAAPLAHLARLDQVDIVKWAHASGVTGPKALDVLYRRHADPAPDAIAHL